MQLSLLQIIALITYGNDYLKNGRLDQKFYPNNSGFNYCLSIGFKELNKITSFTNDPNEWFDYLKNEGCKQLRLFCIYNKNPSLISEDYKFAGWDGHRAWLIEAMYEDYSNFWEDNCVHLPIEKHIEDKYLAVNYTVVAKHVEKQDLQIDLAKTKDELEYVLTKIGASISNSNDKTFTEPKKLLNSDNPHEHASFKDIIPVANYSILAQQILFSTFSAWVFGGMGSWSDSPNFETPEHEKIYRQWAEPLYTILNKSLIASVNSF